MSNSTGRKCIEPDCPNGLTVEDENSSNPCHCRKCRGEIFRLELELMQAEENEQATSNPQHETR